MTDSPWRPRSPLEGQRSCHDCGGPACHWRTGNYLWDEVVGDAQLVLCPACFICRAEARHIGTRGMWVVMPPRLTITEEKARSDEHGRSGT